MLVYTWLKYGKAVSLLFSGFLKKEKKMLVVVMCVIGNNYGSSDVSGDLIDQLNITKPMFAKALYNT